MTAAVGRDHGARRRVLRWAGLGLAACLGPVARPARAAPGITWGLIDWPPLFLFDPARPPSRVAELGDGVADRVMAELVARLPGFQHRFELMNRRRLAHALAARGSEFCYAAMLRTPEREKRYYLVPVAPLPPLALVLRAELLPRLGVAEREGEEASLAALLAHPGLRGALEAQRSYGQLDRLLAAQPTPLPREGVSTPGQLVRLVGRGRYDYTLEYPLTVEHLRRQGALGRAELRTLALVEAREWPVAHVACARNPAGRRAAQAIAGAVAEAARGRALREALPGWLPAPLPPAGRQRLEAYFDGLARGVGVIE